MKPNTGEKGQAVMLYAVFIPLTILFALGIIDYMVTNLRVMDTVAAADLAAHAGAQVVQVEPGGVIKVNPLEAAKTATAYFIRQAPMHAVLRNVRCSQYQGQPACILTATVRSAGFLLPESWIRVDALGVLAFGATRDNQ